MDTDIIQNISCARSWVKLKMMEPCPSLTHKKLARYYNGLGFGINVYLRSHINQDFTMCIVQAHINNHDYQVDDRILCYLAFPRIGMAVALWSGNFLLFNPQEPHSISSRCKSGDKIFCIFSYLKTGVVSLNDNRNCCITLQPPQILTSNTHCAWDGGTFLRQWKKVPPAPMQRQVYLAMDM